MKKEFGSYGEINNKWTSEDAKGFIKVISNQNKIYHYVNNK
jgi:argininosuccinate synthase